MSQDLADMIDDEQDDFKIEKKNRDSEEMDITPMIDITFLLLIFFVVCSKMDPSQTGKIPEADNGEAISAKDSAVIFINPTAGDKVALSRYDGSEFSPDEDTQAAEIIEYIEKEMEKSTGKNKNQVMIMGDENIKVAEVTRVQKIIGDAFPDLNSTYIAVKEQ
ncbi:ExbD/TolR family protein [Stieleria varia]|uniref:Biopolymer transport protein ExbD/TolR n=1 Tax=Stieleria varia TaxID=2528005 RepID=A0A5C6B9K3_9BACT|nr:biopolymer transporter ExbD [Stieleria varia]TWU07999.1 Biopolymer transport protein ExbD/TolR [Stieleria varia]